MITNLRPRTFICWLGVGALLGLGTALAIDARQPLGAWWWDTTHTLPEVVLLVTQDASIGSRMGDYYFDTGYGQDIYDIARAKRLYTISVKMDDTISWPWYQLARIAFLHEEYQVALGYIQTYKDKTDNTRPKVLYLEGLVLGFVGEPQKALAAFGKYYTHDNQSWYIHNNLAWTHFQLGDFVAMDKISAKGLQFHPDNPWLLMNKGLAQYNLGHILTAQGLLKQSYDRARELNPKDWSTTYPGNDPAMAPAGLAEFFSILEANQKLIHRENTQPSANFIK